MRSKGNKAEREVAALLQPWWQKLEPEAFFIRTPLSGGWVQGRDIFQARGDLMVKGAPLFPWCVEVKRRERWTLESFEAGRACQVWGWWIQACGDAKACGKLPMLWFRQNLRPWIVVVAATMGRQPRADFEWPDGIASLEGKAAHPIGFWEDRFLATAPRRWL